MVVLRVALLVAAWVLATPAGAQSMCTFYELNGCGATAGPGTDPAAVCAAWVGQHQKGDCSIPNLTGTSGGIYDGVDFGGSGGAARCLWHWTSNVGVDFDRITAIPDEEAECPDCEAYAETLQAFTFEEADYPGDEFCYEDAAPGLDCTVEHSGPKGVCFQQPSGVCLNTYKITGEGCGEPEPEELDPAQGDGLCYGSAAGPICVEFERDEKNCGTVNGQDVCLGDIPDGNCIFMGDGGMACDSSAASPPAPDDGTTPGTKATPIAELTTLDPATGAVTNTYEFYSSTSVGGSSEPPSGAPPSPPGSGSGDGEGEGVDCGAECGYEAAAAVVNPIEGAPSYGDSIDGFLTAVSAGAGLDEFGGIGSASCPSGDFSLFGETFSFWPVVCDFYDSVSAYLGALMLFVYGFGAVRIFLSA